MQQDSYQQLANELMTFGKKQILDAVSIAVGESLVPVMTVEKFAESSGFPAGVIKGWISKSHIPTQKIGRYRAINIQRLADICRDAH